MPEPEYTNSISTLKNFLGTPDDPVSTAEMNEFWKSLTKEEKDEFKTTDLVPYIMKGYDA